jgi:hypothetical protein
VTLLPSLPRLAKGNIPRRTDALQQHRHPLSRLTHGAKAVVQENQLPEPCLGGHTPRAIRTKRFEEDEYVGGG